MIKTMLVHMLSKAAHAQTAQDNILFRGPICLGPLYQEKRPESLRCTSKECKK